MFKDTSPLLINESPLQVLPSLATRVGLNEAIVLQQIHYWLRHYQKAESNIQPDKRFHYKQGRWWVYNSYADWQESNFPFWSMSTIKRAFKSLERQNLLIAEQLSEDKHDRTNWYAIDYDELNRLCDLEDDDDPDPTPETDDEPAPDSKPENPAGDDPDKTDDPIHEVKMTSWKSSKWPHRSGQDEPMIIRYLTETTQRGEEEVNDGAAIAATAAEKLVIPPDLAEVVGIFADTGRELDQDTLIRMEQMAKRCHQTACQNNTTGGQWLAAALTLALGKAQPESVLNYADAVIDGWVERGYRKRPKPKTNTDEVSTEMDIFEQATGRLPLPDQRDLVASLINTHNFTAQDLRHYWEAWITRDKKRTSLIWLTDWAVKGIIPKPYQKPTGPSKNIGGVSPAVAEYVKEKQDQAQGARQHGI